jgi:hypothetical protein
MGTKNKEIARESPLTYVENIKTLFSRRDRRTGFVQGEMLFRSLKVLGRPVEYVVHPGAHMKLPEVEITDNEWINCCEPLNSLKGGLIKGKTTSHQLCLLQFMR